MIPNISSASLKANEFNQLPQFHVPVDTYYDGTAMTDAKCGGLYNKINDTYVRFANIEVRLSQLAAPTQDRFAKAIAEMDALGGGRLIIDAILPITSNITVPESVTIVANKLGRFQIASGITLTINGNVENGTFWIFEIADLTCSILGSLKSNIGGLCPENFGANGVDGSVDDTFAVNCTGKVCKDLKVAFLILGIYGVTNAKPYSYVNYRGASKAMGFKLIDPNGVSAPFFTSGIQRGTFYVRNNKPLNDVVAGNATVTLTNIGDITPKQGDIVIISSTTHYSSGGNDQQPIICLLNMVQAYDDSTGIITLDSPILDDIIGAQIALENDYTDRTLDDGMIAYTSFSNFSIWVTTKDSTIRQQAFGINAAYHCEWDNLDYYYSESGQNSNGLSYCKFSRINCYQMRLLQRILEIKIGSYLSSFDNFYCEFEGTTTLGVGLLEFGEFAQRLSANNIRFNFPNVTHNGLYVIGLSGSGGNNHSFTNIKGIMYQCITFFSVNSYYSVVTSADNITANNLELIVLNQITYGVRVPSFTYNNLNIQNVKVKGTFIGAILILYGDTNTNYNNCFIRGIKGDGKFSLSFSTPYSDSQSYDISISDITCTGVEPYTNNNDITSYLQPYQINISKINRTNAAKLMAATNIQAGLSASYSASSSLFNLLLPTSNNFSYVLGDKIRIKLFGSFVGNTGAKTLVIDDNVFSNPINISIPATSSTTTTTYYFDIDIEYKLFEGNTSLGIDVKAKAVVNGETTIYTGSSTLSKDNAFSIAGSTTLVDGDSLNIFSSEIKPELIYI